MRNFVKGLLVAAGLTLGANTVLATPVNDWTEQFFKAKIGRNTPAEEARLRAERTLAFREEAPLKVDITNWLEEHLKAKLGRYSPTEEARLREIRGVFRDEAPVTFAAPNWVEQLFRAKLGRWE